ncbi:MAG: hypothetical protein ACK4YP_16080, partial [Myxococcota bacterium]
MIPALALALAADGLRAAAEAADARRDWPVALSAWRACEAGAGARDGRSFATRAAALAPQAADGFAGLDV